MGRAGAGGADVARAAGTASMTDETVAPDRNARRVAIALSK